MNDRGRIYLAQIKPVEDRGKIKGVEKRRLKGDKRTSIW